MKITAQLFWLNWQMLHYLVGIQLSVDSSSSVRHGPTMTVSRWNGQDLSDNGWQCQPGVSRWMGLSGGIRPTQRQVPRSGPAHILPVSGRVIAIHAEFVNYGLGGPGCVLRHLPSNISNNFKSAALGTFVSCVIVEMGIGISFNFNKVDWYVGGFDGWLSSAWLESSLY